MYSYEIDNIIKQNNYNLSSTTYIDICTTSSQINHVKYEPYGDYYEICTSDGYYWKINVYKV